MQPDSLPRYVNPAVLQPGATVVALLDDSQTRLVVLRVEPLVVCAQPDGSEVTLFAHEVELADQPAPFREVKDGSQLCADCGHAHTVATGECSPDSSVCNCEWFRP